MKKTAGLLLMLAASTTPQGLSATEQNRVAQFFVKPSDVQVPRGLDWGQYRRIVQPFENWTLICDEDLKKKEKVCNISQTIIDRFNKQVFSWSLAATRDGAPMMILRAPSGTNTRVPLRVIFPGREKPVLVDYRGCDELVCIAIMAVGAIAREHIGRSSDLSFIYALDVGRQVTVSAPLQGLKSALEAIR
ncbi:MULTISPECIES: invasion associated locus B family protein [Agrobacterium]|uniref:invasion associated locus B family protein n=1 Tax=Agrobacterium TaxID=357 RepID=UPI00254F965A|nr:invasion associated locus B family protein [Agrobacterium sp. CFBP2214]